MKIIRNGEILADLPDKSRAFEFTNKDDKIILGNSHGEILLGTFENSLLLVKGMILAYIGGNESFVLPH